MHPDSDTILHSGRRPRAMAWGTLISISAVAVLCLTAGGQGWTWDEVYYFLSSQLQVTWAREFALSLVNGDVRHLLSRDILDSFWLWDINHNPHPAFYKILSSASWLLFRNLVGDLIAFRLSTAFIAGALCLCLYLVVVKPYGRLPAAFAACSLMLMPRFFGHAHLATTEVPLAALWFFSCWLFYRGISSRWASLLLGLVWGCALATKFTAVLIPVPLLLWTVIFRQYGAWRNVLCLIIIAPLAAVALNPGWWHAPVDKIMTFLYMSISRRETIAIGTFFLGKTYTFRPPWYYPPVMLGLTIPLSIIFTMCLGLIQYLKKLLSSRYDTLFLINIPFILLVVMLPAAPVHDGIRQFFALLPFCAYLAGMGLYYLQQAVYCLKWSSYASKTLMRLCTAGMLLYPAAGLYTIHPYELSYYNELIGGLQGAYDRGMEITYWFDAVNESFLTGFERTVPQGSAVAVWPPNAAYFCFLQEQELITNAVSFLNPDDAAWKDIPTERPVYLVLLSRLATFTPFYWNIFFYSKPAFSCSYDGVQLIGIYAL